MNAGALPQSEPQGFCPVKTCNSKHATAHLRYIHYRRQAVVRAPSGAALYLRRGAQRLGMAANLQDTFGESDEEEEFVAPQALPGLLYRQGQRCLCYRALNNLL